MCQCAVSIIKLANGNVYKYSIKSNEKRENVKMAMSAMWRMKTKKAKIS
jgi:hypothetical protein